MVKDYLAYKSMRGEQCNKWSSNTHRVASQVPDTFQFEDWTKCINRTVRGKISSGEGEDINLWHRENCFISMITIKMLKNKLGSKNDLIKLSISFNSDNIHEILDSMAIIIIWQPSWWHWSKWIFVFSYFLGGTMVSAEIRFSQGVRNQ